jgi:hypothetical protein
VVWLAINSTNPAHSNFRDEARSAQIVKDWKMVPTALSVDKGRESGPGLWCAYYAAHVRDRSQRHRDPALEDRRQGELQSARRESAKNFVAAALDESMAASRYPRPALARTDAL